MRTGLAVSIVAHFLLLAIGFINLGFIKPLMPAVEAIAVDLVPIEEYSNIRAGQLASDIVETQNPSVVESAEQIDLAQPAGNIDENQVIPSPADMPTPVPVTNAAPAPPEGEPEPESASAPVMRPVPASERMQESSPVPEPSASPQPPVPHIRPASVSPLAADPALESTSGDAPLPEPAPALETPRIAAPQPASRPSNLDRLRQDFAAAEAERRRHEEEERRRAADAANAAQPVVRPQPRVQLDASLADDIAAIINNDRTTGGATGQGGGAALGDVSGASARLSRSEIDGLVSQIRDCWTLLPSDINSGLNVRLMVSFNRDGTVDGIPSILSADASRAGEGIARAAQRAVVGCAPYRLPTDAYDEWRQIEVELRP